MLDRVTLPILIGDLLDQALAPPSSTYDLGGNWIMYKDYGQPGVMNKWNWSSAGPNFNFHNNLAGQTVAPSYTRVGDVWNGFGAHPVVKTLWLGFASPIGNGYMTNRQWWTKLAGAPGYAPRPLVRTHPGFGPSVPVPNWLDPNSAPVTWPEPMTVPRPVPYRLAPKLRPNPARAPSERTESGYAPPAPFPYGIGVPAARTAPPVSSPSPQRSPVVVITPGRPPRLTTEAPPRFKRPERGTHERKFSGRQVAYPAIARTMGSVTEIMDIFGAAYEALPDHVQTGRSFPEKMRILYQNINSIQLADFVTNLAAENAQDRVFARLSSRGFGSGPWDTAPGQYATEVQRNERRRERAQARADAKYHRRRNASRSTHTWD